MKRLWFALGWMGLQTAAVATTYYVDQKHPSACDTNSGALEAPFKTLTRAGTMARPGDQVYIRAGVYRETLRILSPNSYPANEPARRVPVRGWRDGAGPDTERIVFEAFGDEEVIIDGAVALARERWQPVEGKPGLYSQLLTGAFDEVLREDRSSIEKFEPGYVFWSDARIMPHRERDAQGLWQAGLPAASSAPAWHYDTSNRLFYAHLGGADPRREGQLELAVRQSGVEAGSTRRVTLRKLQVRRVAVTGIEIAGSEDAIVEDCRVTQARWNGIRASCCEPVTVRRCWVDDVDGRSIDTTCSHSALICDNVVADFSQAKRGYFNYAYIVFGGKFNQFYHNCALSSDPDGLLGGFWTDCAGVGHLWLGNAAVRCNYYIESPAVNNLVQWNTVWRTRHQGLYLRANFANLVRENLAAYSGSGLVIASTEWGAAGNVFIQNWLKQNRSGVSVGSEPEHNGEQTLNFTQGNVYETATNGIFGGWAGRSYRTIEEFRAGTDQETMGRETEIDYEALGLVWVRAEGAGLAHEPFPMFSNPRFARLGTQFGTEPYFWRRGDASGSDGFPGEWAPGHRFSANPFAGQGFADERCRPAGWNEQLGWSRWPSVAPVEGTPVSGVVLHLGSFPERSLDARGVGCWSPSLPTVGGAVIDVALWMKATGIVAAGEGGGAVAYVEWSDRTGQHKSRSYVVGGEKDAELVHPEFSRGSRDWGRVAAAVTAPPAARRFALYLGMRNAAGQAMFDAVEQIRTRPGAAPAAAVDKRSTENLPLVNPGKLAFKIVDLSAAVNRLLKDEQADDGKGGWTDQGPGYDMRDLLTGRQEHEGVPYEILAPKSCVVLRSHRRPQSASLPEEVAFPVGAAARVLYFLHSGAWMNDGDRHWTYEVHYADGKRETIPVIGGVNVRDWGQAGEPYDFPRTANRRTTIWPQKVGNMLSPTCGLYVMEWLNPRPDIVIREIRMAAAPDGGVPVLLGITAGSDK